MSRRKKLLLWLSPVTAVAVIAVVAGIGLEATQKQAEQLATTGRGAIQLLGEYGTALKERDLEQVDRLLAVDAERGNIAFAGLAEDTRRSSDGVSVYAWNTPAQASAVGGLSEQLVALLDTVTLIDHLRLKLLRVEEMTSPSESIVQAALLIHGKGNEQTTLDSHARYRLWLTEEPAGWRIKRQVLLAGTTIEGRGQGFEDVAQAVGLTHTSALNPDLAHAPQARAEMIKFTAGAVATADIDGDGWFDLFFGDGVSSRLYRNLDGTFVDQTLEAGLPDDLGAVHVALLADFDNDGDPDLFVGRFTQPNRLFRNDGDGTFTDVSETARLGRSLVSTAAAGDFDGDGLIDLYLGRYLDPRTSLPSTLFYSRNGDANSLLRNLGGLRFEDVTETAEVGDVGLTLATTWADFDDDGDPDLHVANDFGRNVLYRNDGDGRFTDVAAETGSIDFGFGMSSEWGDVDNDGDLDLYVANMHSGQRWYSQAATLRQYIVTSIRQGTFLKDLPLYLEIYDQFDHDIGQFGDRVIKGSSLLINQADRFEDIAEQAGANPFGWYWGSAMFDFDQDGDLDIYSGNGWISGRTLDDL